MTTLRMGFIHSGVLAGSGFKHGRWLDTVFMQLAMNGGKDAAPDPDSHPQRHYLATAPAQEAAREAASSGKKPA